MSSPVRTLPNNLSNTNITFRNPSFRKPKSFDAYLSSNKNQKNEDSVNKTIERDSEKSEFSLVTTESNDNYFDSPTNILENEKSEFDHPLNSSNELDNLLSQLGDFKDCCTQFIKNFSWYTPLLYTFHAIYLLGQLLNGCAKEIKSVFSRMTVA